MSGSTSSDLLALASPGVGMAALLKHALDAGADPNATYIENVATPSLSPLLKKARESGNYPAGWENQTTLLEMASSYKDNVDTVKLLLAAKADANATCWLSQTALCRAIIVGAADTVDVLLTAGAEPSTSYAGLVQSEPWGGEIGCCIPYRQRGVDDMVVPDQPEEHDPAHLDILNMLLARTTANVNATTDHGLTALHNAARCGFGPIVERLIAAGADLNHDADGYSYEMRGTPLRVAIVARHLDVVLLLLRSKASVTARVSTQVLKVAGTTRAKGNTVFTSHCEHATVHPHPHPR